MSAAAIDIGRLGGAFTLGAAVSLVGRDGAGTVGMTAFFPRIGGHVEFPLVSGFFSCAA
jgi:hypothetical protein